MSVVSARFYLIHVKCLLLFIVVVEIEWRRCERTDLQVSQERSYSVPDW